MPTAETLIPASFDCVKCDTHAWHPCALCSTPIGMEYEFCFYCEKLPGFTVSEKRFAGRAIAHHRRARTVRRFA